MKNGSLFYLLKFWTETWASNFIVLGWESKYQDQFMHFSRLVRLACSIVLVLLVDFVAE